MAACDGTSQQPVAAPAAEAPAADAPAERAVSESAGTPDANAELDEIIALYADARAQARTGTALPKVSAASFLE